MLLSNDDSESNKSVDSKNNQEDAKIAEPKQPIKKGTSKFYPKAKGLHPENKDEDNKLEEVENDTKVNIDSMQEEDEGKDQKNKELKLSHKNIAAFYPKENAKEVASPKTGTKADERIKSAIENKRYMSKSNKKDGVTKSQDFNYTGPYLQKNALVTVMNSPSAVGNKPKVNEFMMASIKNQDELPPYGPGYGQNPRINKITQEDKIKRRVENEEINLNITSFYESNKSTIEAQKLQEDEEAKE